MRVSFVRNVGLGMVALVGLGLAGCDDSPTDFDNAQTVKITTNPSSMVVPAGVTTLLESRTENAGNEPTFEEITATVDPTCGAASVGVATAATFEPSIQPPGQFDVTGGTTLGSTCLNLSGGGASAVVEITIVGDSLVILNAPDTLNLNSSVQLSAALLSDDGTAVGPFDPLTDITWSSDDTDVLTVDGTGLVTAVGAGAATITATWTDAGVSVSESVTITTDQPALAIVGVAASDTLTIFDTVDLSATLTSPPGTDFGPFDPDTDVMWSTSDAAVVTVDAVTGEIEAVGPGTATITATWAGNATVTATAEILVQVPPPVLTSASVATADPGDAVALVGTGFIPGAHTIYLDGEPLVDSFFMADISTATTASFLMFAGADGDVDITVGTDASQSNAITVTRTNGTDEPDDSGGGPTTPNAASIPYNVVGYLEHDSDPDDFYLITVGGATTITIDLTWVDNSQDLDILVTDGAFSAFVCTDGATAPGASPVEQSVCDLPAAGDYLVWINHFAPTGGTSGYELDIN